MAKLKKQAVQKKKSFKPKKSILNEKSKTDKLPKMKADKMPKMKPAGGNNKKFIKKNKPRNVDSESEESDFEIALANTVLHKASAETQVDAANAELDTRAMVKKQNKKHAKSGGFQSMGLSHLIFKGVIRKGYKVPTPIQRKTTPLIMDLKDVSDHLKTREMCNAAVEKAPYTIKDVSDHLKTQEMCNEARLKSFLTHIQIKLRLQKLTNIFSWL